MPGPTDNPFHARPPEPDRAPAPAASVPLIPRRAAMALVTTVMALLLLLRFDPGTDPNAQVTSATTAPADPAASDTGAGDTGTGDPAATPTTGPESATGGGTTASTQVAGDAVATRFGTVQVKVTIDGGTLVDVSALQLPSGGRDSQVSAYAEPILRSEALQAGNAGIDTVTGATYTSMGYIQSLQSALDTAGIG
jgi:FMN-binding protein